MSRQRCKRYRGRIRTWQLTAGGNASTVLGLGEDEMLWLTLRIAEAARQYDPNVEVMIGLSQPWGEYLVEAGATPFAFCFRRHAGTLWFEPGRPQPGTGHGRVAARQLLSRFAGCLAPHRPVFAAGSAAANHAGLAVGCRPRPLPARKWPPRRPLARRLHTRSASRLGRRLRPAGAMQADVSRVQWTHLSDAEPNFPGGGLVDGQGNVKPALARLGSVACGPLAVIRATISSVARQPNDRSGRAQSCFRVPRVRETRKSPRRLATIREVEAANNGNTWH